MGGVAQEALIRGQRSWGQAVGNRHGRNRHIRLFALAKDLCLELGTVNAAIRAIGIHRCPPNLGGHHRQEPIGRVQDETARRARRIGHDGPTFAALSIDSPEPAP